MLSAECSDFANESMALIPVQGYLTYKKTNPPRTLQKVHVQGLTGVLGGWEVSYKPVRILTQGGHPLSRTGVPVSASTRFGTQHVRQDKILACK